MRNAPAARRLQVSTARGAADRAGRQNGALMHAGWLLAVGPMQKSQTRSVRFRIHEARATCRRGSGPPRLLLAACGRPKRQSVIQTARAAANQERRRRACGGNARRRTLGDPIVRRRAPRVDLAIARSPRRSLRAPGRRNESSGACLRSFPSSCAVPGRSDVDGHVRCVPDVVVGVTHRGTRVRVGSQLVSVDAWGRIPQNRVCDDRYRREGPC